MALLTLIRRLIGRSCETPANGAEASPTAASAADAPAPSNFVEEPPFAPVPAPSKTSAPDEEIVIPENEWWHAAPVEDAPAAARPPGGVDAALREQLVRVLDDPNCELPRLPQVAQRALFMLSRDDVEYQRLAELVGQEPALTADVLRVANSVIYRGVEEVRRLDHAFARLGQRTLRQIVMATTVKGMAIRTGGADRSIGEQLWQAALASAVLVEEVGKRVGLGGDEMFLIGLLHDIGSMAILNVVHRHEQRHKRQLPREAFDSLCRDWHEHIGLRLSDAWNLPAPLPEIIASHHREPADDDPHAKRRRVVQFVDACCGRLGYAANPPGDFFALPGAVGLGFQDDDETRRFLRTLPAVLAEKAALF